MGGWLLQAGTYWRYNFKPMMRSKQLQSYVVLDVEPAGEPDKRFTIADVQASLLNSSFIRHARPFPLHVEDKNAYDKWRRH